MQAGTLANSDVRASTSRVLVNGTVRPHLSWSVDRELTGDMPEQVVAAAGITPATGTIVFAGEDVEQRARNPFNASTGWLPRKGDRVQIFAGDGATEWVQFTGVISKPSGDARGGFQATIIDDYDKLSASVSHLPLLRIMPPLVETDPYRGVGLSSIHYVDHALRAAGFYSTPPTEHDSAVAVTCQGSMWPSEESSGILKSGGSFTGTASHHSNNAAPWGWSVGNFDNFYTPRVSYAPGVPLQLTMMVAANHAGTAYAEARYGSATDYVRLVVTSSRVAILRINDVEVCTLALGTATMVTALVKAGYVTLKSSTGASASGIKTPSGTTMTEVRLSGDEASRVAGIQVSHPATVSQEFASLSWVPSAVLDLSNVIHIGLMDAGPGIENEPAEDLLKRICGSLLIGMWLDETGVLRVVPTLALRARPAVRTLTTLDDILDLDWEDSLLGSRSKVTVTGKIPAIDKGRYRNKLLYQGSGETLNSEDYKAVFISPESDVDWIMPDDKPQIINSGAVEASFNAGRGSFFFASVASDGDKTDNWGQDYVTFGIRKISAKTWKISHRVATISSGSQIHLKTPLDPDLWPKWQEFPGPVIRGFGRVEWAPVSVVPTTAGGIGPELVHDVGVWNNREDDNEWLSRIADYLAGQTATPLPTITGLDVVDDPRLQLGDVVTVSSPRLLGVTMNALIVGMNRSGDKGGTTLSLSVRIISIANTFTTFAAYNDALAGANLTYTQWDALGPKPQTYEQFNDAA